jgi:phosphoribosylglycinamide formyltransferase 1
MPALETVRVARRDLPDRERRDISKLMTKTLAVLVSGSGSTLQNLMDRSADGMLSARVGVVVGSREKLGAEARAVAAGVPYHVVSRKSFADVGAFSDRVFDHARAVAADLVVCAGWLQLLRVPRDFVGRVVNVHPSLLPSFGGQGMYGIHVHDAVINHGCRVSGCTVHFVDDAYDAGPIIAQRSCKVDSDDTPQSLAERVQSLERELLPGVINEILAGRVGLDGRRVVFGPAKK